MTEEELKFRKSAAAAAVSSLEKIVCDELLRSARKGAIMRALPLQLMAMRFNILLLTSDNSVDIRFYDVKAQDALGCLQGLPTLPFSIFVSKDSVKFCPRSGADELACAFKTSGHDYRRIDAAGRTVSVTHVPSVGLSTSNIYTWMELAGVPVRISIHTNDDPFPFNRKKKKEEKGGKDSWARKKGKPVFEKEWPDCILLTAQSFSHDVQFVSYRAD